MDILETIPSFGDEKYTERRKLSREKEVERRTEELEIAEKAIVEAGVEYEDRRG